MNKSYVEGICLCFYISCSVIVILKKDHQQTNTCLLLLQSIIWTFSIVLMFCNHNVSRDGSSLVIRWNLLCWVRSIELAPDRGMVLPTS
jgi:hypothetical protein